MTSTLTFSFFRCSRGVFRRVGVGVGPFGQACRPPHLLQNPQLALFAAGLRMMSGNYTAVQRGSLHKENYRLYLKDAQGRLVSPFHDVPLFHDEKKSVFNMVVEVPRWSIAKLEINKAEKLNPIKQDVKKGKLRFVNNCYPYVGYIWNYGALPQTWENPAHVDQDTHCKGDGDPIDVCEIGQRIKKRGEVVAVKIIGVVALVDEGETDWKLLAIDTQDPLAEKINNVVDMEEHMPGLLADTVRWLKIYKIPDVCNLHETDPYFKIYDYLLIIQGKPANTFAFNGEAKDQAFSLKLIRTLHEQWKKMMEESSDPKGLSRLCSTYNCTSRVSQEEAEGAVSKDEAGPDGELDNALYKWHFVKL